MDLLNSEKILDFDDFLRKSMAFFESGFSSNFSENLKNSSDSEMLTFLYPQTGFSNMTNVGSDYYDECFSGDESTRNNYVNDLVLRDSGLNSDVVNSIDINSMVQSAISNEVSKMFANVSVNSLNLNSRVGEEQVVLSDGNSSNVEPVKIFETEDVNLKETFLAEKENYFKWFDE